MNSEQLRYFELAYEEKNFSAAARRVPISPQGLTKAIHALERELDAPLFEVDQVSGMPVPTPYAEELIEWLEVHNSNLRLLHDQIARIRGEQKQVIDLGCSIGTIAAFGPKFFSDFESLHPDVKVNCWESGDDLCDQAVASGRFAMALSVNPAPAGFVSVDLMRADYCFWVPADDPLASRGTLGIHDLEGRVFACPGEGFKCLASLRALAKANGVQLGELYQVSEMYQLYEFAATGKGLAFTVGHLTDHEVFNNPHKVRALSVDGLQWGFCIERLATRALDSSERALWDWCVMRAHDLPGSLV